MGTLLALFGRMIRLLPILFLTACGVPAPYHCDSTVFASVDSVLPLNCATFDGYAYQVAPLFSQFTQVSVGDWFAKMRHVTVTIRSIPYWCDVSGECVTGMTHPDHINLAKGANELAHESLHAYDLRQDMDRADSLLAYPVEAFTEGNHDGWEERGYWKVANTWHVRCFEGWYGDIYENPDALVAPVAGDEVGLEELRQRRLQ